MLDKFVTFQSFTDPSIAQELVEKLRAHGIPYQFEDTSSPIDPVIVGSPLAADLRLKIRQQDFERANLALDEIYTEQLETVEKDYYLFSFSDKELWEIIEKPDEWGRLDYKLSQKILKERGNEVSTETLKALRADRIKEVSKPEKVGISWIFLGYLLSVLFSPIGIFYSSTLLTLKKTLPNGNRSYVYSDHNRKHARIMLIVSSALTTLWLVMRVLLARQD